MGFELVRYKYRAHWQRSAQRDRGPQAEGEVFLNNRHFNIINKPRVFWGVLGLMDTGVIEGSRGGNISLLRGKMKKTLCQNLEIKILIANRDLSCLNTL